MSLWYLALSFWGILIVLGIVFVAISMVAWGILAIILCLIFFSILPSFFIGKSLGLSRWYNEIAMCGVSKLGYSMSMLGRTNMDKRLWYEPMFVFYWGFTIKYLIPIVLWLILCNAVKNDITNPYGGYDIGW